jgi:hypothetical protein
MKRVVITFGARPTADYPLAVVVFDGDQRGQDNMVRSVRDGRLFANGLCAGALHAQGDIRMSDWPVNPEIDPRLTDV